MCSVSVGGEEKHGRDHQEVLLSSAAQLSPIYL